MHTTYGMDTCTETNEILAFGMEVYSRYIPDICKNLEYVRHIPDICLTYDTIRIPNAVLTSDIPILADSSHLPSDEAYRQCLSPPCNHLSTPCYECKPNTRHFFDKIFIKVWFCWGRMCLFCHMTSVGWLEIMIQHTPSIVYDFHFPVDFRLDILFPHIFWFLHQNWVGIGWFTLTKLRHVGDEEETIPSGSDTRSPMTAPPVLPQCAFGSKKNRLAEVRLFRVFDLRHFKCSESECLITAGKPVRTDGVGWNVTHHFR